jgi:murein DD-endopeptidase MepM/ murein hydrolase activator NlpD
MGLHKCNVGFIWSLILAIILTVIPRYWELKIESAPTFNAPSDPPKPQVVEDTIHKNTTLVATLVDYDVPIEIATDVADLIKPVFDVRKLRFGNPFRLEKAIDGSLRAFEYKIDDERILKVEKGADAYAARVEKLDFDVQQTTLSAEINSSLYAAMDQFPKGEVLTNALVEMFQYQVDFSMEIRRGDQVHMIVEEQYHDGKFVKYGKIQAAELVNAGRSYRAFLFNDAYYDEKGIAVKRDTLASPLKFTRVSSGFTTARLHPILGDVRAHLAVDYAAPTGTPVIAVANGTVLSAGWVNGYGNFVQIKHANGVVTGYGHLSKIASGVRAGRPIKQSDLVGLVGMTGLATGPHLHFMMLKSGKAVNPIPALKKGQPADPLASSVKAAFLQHIGSYQTQLQNLVAAK